MLRPAALALVTAVALLAGCSRSTLSEDDQAFCSDQDDELAALRESVDDLVEGDRHFSSDGEGFALYEVVVEPASNWLGAQNLQDPDLADLVESTGSAVFYVRLYATDEGQLFADDAAVPREARAKLQELEEFCDENG